MLFGNTISGRFGSLIVIGWPHCLHIDGFSVANFHACSSRTHTHTCIRTCARLHARTHLHIFFSVAFIKYGNDEFFYLKSNAMVKFYQSYISYIFSYHQYQTFQMIYQFVHIAICHDPRI